MHFVDQALHVLASLFLVAVGTTLLVLFVLLFVDLAQTGNAVRRNYPVIGRFRPIFESLGEFMRQYMFAMDREELPFNRAQRGWVERAASAGSMTVAFGSTRETRVTGTSIFVNAPFSLLDEECRDTSEVTVGPNGPNPYTTNRIFHISGMSFGAISRPAVMALGKGAAQAGCWMNTGEGGLSPWHLEAGNDVVFQFGTAKNGIRTPDGALCEKRLKGIGAEPQVKMIEIKLSQGAKPGKGGILPGGKVTKEIAWIRGIRAGQDAISPNRHREVSNSGELLDLINRVRDIGVASGKLVTPAEVAWALCAGADFAVSARGFMFALGCIQAMRCNKNTCPTGITTHNPRLQRGLNPPAKAVSVANYQRRVEEELKIIAHSCGVAEPRLLRREHCRIMQPDGQSVLLSELSCQGSKS